MSCVTYRMTGLQILTWPSDSNCVLGKSHLIITSPPYVSGFIDNISSRKSGKPVENKVIPRGELGSILRPRLPSSTGRQSMQTYFSEHRTFTFLSMPSSPTHTISCLNMVFCRFGQPVGCLLQSHGEEADIKCCTASFSYTLSWWLTNSQKITSL